MEHEAITNENEPENAEEDKSIQQEVPQLENFEVPSNMSSHPEENSINATIQLTIEKSWYAHLFVKYSWSEDGRMFTVEPVSYFVVGGAVGFIRVLFG